MFRISGILLALGGSLLASAAHADVVTYQQMLGSSTAPVPIAGGGPAITLPDFNPALGTLTQATLALVGEVTPDLYFPMQDLSHSFIALTSYIGFSLGGGATDTTGHASGFNLQLPTELLPQQYGHSAIGTPSFVEDYIFLDLSSVTHAGSGAGFSVGTQGSTDFQAFPTIDATGLQDRTGFYGQYDIIYSYNVPEPSAILMLLTATSLLLFVCLGRSAFGRRAVEA